jgi:hypothetical protein
MTSEWLTDDVQVPKGLLDALVMDRLVIFAGAGASIPSPTRLPAFDQLAQSIASNAGYPHVLADKSRIDSFLGKVEDFSGANVHRMAAELLATGRRRANRVHKALVRLSAIGTLTHFSPKR